MACTATRVSVTSAGRRLTPRLLLHSPPLLPAPLATLIDNANSSDPLTNRNLDSSRNTNAAGGSEGSDTVESFRRTNAALVTTALAVSALAAGCSDTRVDSCRVGAEEGAEGGCGGGRGARRTSPALYISAAVARSRSESERAMEVRMTFWTRCCGRTSRSVAQLGQVGGLA